MDSCFGFHCGIDFNVKNHSLSSKICLITMESHEERSHNHRRFRKRLNYTDQFEIPTSIQLSVIGHVCSPYRERFGTPRQAVISKQTLNAAPQNAYIQLVDNEKLRMALRGLDKFERCWIISYMHLNQGWNPLVKPPRGPKAKQGLFSTRAPHRPNSIALSALKITKVDHTLGQIHVFGIDLLDQTPVLDIKPYVPYADAFPNSAAGWLDGLDMHEADRKLFYHSISYCLNSFY